MKSGVLICIVLFISGLTNCQTAVSCDELLNKEFPIENIKESEAEILSNLKMIFKCTFDEEGPSRLWNMDLLFPLLGSRYFELSQKEPNKKMTYAFVPDLFKDLVNSPYYLELLKSDTTLQH